MINETKLTGRTRCRVVNRIFGSPLVVLQVEEQYEPNFYRTYYRWRDATVEDLTISEEDECLKKSWKAR